MNIQKVYFDNAATTPISNEVIDVMVDSLKNNFGNPSSTHSFGRESKSKIEESRRTISKCLNVKPNQIFFNSCGTEGNNFVLKSCIKDLEIERIVSNKIEHNSVIKTLLNNDSKIDIEFVKVKKNGEVDLDHLEETLSSSNVKTMVSIMYVNNELGTINDILRIGDLCLKNKAFFHCDMVQAIGHINIDLNVLNVDFATASAHKFHGPKGAGFIYIKNSNNLRSMISGGSQERGIRSGTENIASILGMAKALELITLDIENDILYINNLRKYFVESLLSNKINIELITSLDNSICTILSIAFPEYMNNDLMSFQLDMLGVCCSSGSACSSGATERSYVLENIDFTKEKKVIRFSFSKYNTKEEIDFAVDKIIQISKSILLEK